MKVVFIAGAGTDVGKTHVAEALVRRLRDARRPVVAVKPVASGVGAWDAPAFGQSDTARLLAAQGIALTQAAADACTPWRFAAPLAPNMAARREGRRLTLAQLVAFHAQTLAASPPDATVLVEGVGGVMSPVAADATGLDWLLALDAEVLLVGGSYLGAISHTLTALETLAARARPACAVVVSESEASPVALDETVESLREHTAAPVHVLSRGGELQALELASTWL